MIEKMKKLTLLVAEKERDDFLLALRRAGVVHVSRIKEPETLDITETEEEFSAVKKAISILSVYEKTKGTGQKEKKEAELYFAAEKIIEAFNEKEKLVGRLRGLEKEREWFETWGKADPETIRDLKDKGVNIRLYRLGKDDYRKVKGKDSVRVIARDSAFIYVALLTYGTGDKLDFEEVNIPAKNISAIEEGISALKAEGSEREAYLKNASKDLAALEKLKEKVSRKLELLSVKFGMKDEDKFSYLQGFCPSRYLGKVLQLAKEHAFGYIVEEAGETPETPTLITNPAWIDIIKPVFQFMTILPGYNEFDVSLAFLVFLSLFFAMLVGDAGYGMIFLLITHIVHKRARNLPKQPIVLMYLMSGATIVWGALTGTWFGPSQIAKLPILSGMVVQKLNNQDFMMFFCFLIGAVHMTIAHLIRIYRFLNSPKVLADIGWVMVIWGMFFLAGFLVINRPFPGFAAYLIYIGSGLVLVFESFQKNILKGMGQTLINLPLSVIATFSDVVSYLRLFAVGYASVVVSQSFNEMAIGDGVNGVISGLVTALILFFGHLLNAVLSIMAVLVHGVRLNMLEFSSHLKMEWSGKQYKPFAE